MSPIRALIEYAKKHPDVPVSRVPADRRRSKLWFLEGLVCNQCGAPATTFSGEGEFRIGRNAKFSAACPCGNRAAGVVVVDGNMTLEQWVREFVASSIAHHADSDTKRLEGPQ